jgi:peptide methionine sulfoxide reductase MsrA
VVATEVGFAGGTTARPSYHDLGDHVEAVRVTYDPEMISYEELLRVYWNSHPHDLPAPEDPRVAVAVLFDGELQRQQARDFLRSVGGRVAVSELRALGHFTPAELRQQKFHLQRARPALVARLADTYPSLEAFLRSTAAARIHAVFRGVAGPEALAEAAAELGMEAEQLARLLRRAPEP